MKSAKVILGSPGKPYVRCHIALNSSSAQTVLGENDVPQTPGCCDSDLCLSPSKSTIQSRPEAVIDRLSISHRQQLVTKEDGAKLN